MLDVAASLDGLAAVNAGDKYADHWYPFYDAKNQLEAVFAQTTVSSEFYVVRDEATKKCTIVDKKPTTTTTIVDNGVFKTRAEAETGMKTTKVCTTN